MNSKSVFVNRNVIFQEDIFPFKHMLSPGSTIFPVLDLLSPISEDPKLSSTDSSPSVDVPPYEACVTCEGEPSLSHIADSHHTPDYSTSPTNPPGGLLDKVAPVDTHAEAHLKFYRRY